MTGTSVRSPISVCVTRRSCSRCVFRKLWHHQLFALHHPYLKHHRYLSQSVTVNRLNSPHRKMTRASSQWLQLFHPTKHFLKFSRVSYPSGHSDYLSACETRHGLPLQEPRDCESFEGRLESATISGAVQEPWQATDSHPSVVGTQGKGWNERTS